KDVYADGHEHPDIAKYCQMFLLKIIQLERFMSKWVDPECKIRTFSDLNFLEREQLLKKKDLDVAMHIINFLTEIIGQLKDDQEEACVIIV
ncbi:7838_t:CDS:2, partial [Cetraspora pellucida]